MASYNAYLLATVLPPLLIVFSILLISYSVWGITYLIFRSRIRKEAENGRGETIIEYPGLHYMYMALQPVFGNRLEARSTQYRVKLKLHGQEIYPSGIPLHVQSVALALGLSLAVFLTTLTVEIGSVCNERLDCFPFDYSKQIQPLITDPIQNCSLYYTRNEISITCFQFTIRLVDALSSSGGMLILTTMGLNFYITMLFIFAQVRCCRQTGLFMFFLLLIISSVIIFSTLLWCLPLVFAQSETFELVKNWESVLIYYYTIMYLILIATILPFCVPRNRQDFSRCYNNNRRRFGYEAPQNHESDTGDEEDTPNTSVRSEQRSNGQSITLNQNRHPNHQRGYYGSVDGCRRLHVPLPSQQGEEVSPHVDKQSEETSDLEWHDMTGHSSGTTEECREEESRGGGKGPVVYRVKSVRRQFITKQETSKKKKHRAGQGREGKNRKGRHWAEMGQRRDDLAMEGEEDLGMRRDSENLSSSEEAYSEVDRPRVKGRRQGERRVTEDAQIRAVLTGDVVENGERNGEILVHTHL